MTQTEAREYVKKHLQRAGETQNIIVTPTLVMRWWNVLNVAVFDGKLLRPAQIYISNYRGYWGECIGVPPKKNKPRRTKLKFRDKFATKRMFLAALVHEMVHMWEYQHHTKMGHSKRFFAWKETIQQAVNLELDVQIGHTDYLQWIITKKLPMSAQTCGEQ